MSTQPTMAQLTDELRERRAAIELGGGAARQDKQRAQGKLTARERIDALLDPGTFVETGMFAQHRSTYFGLAEAELAADGVVTGEGAVRGRPVHVASQDFTVAGGSAGEVHSDKVAAMMKASLMTGTPFVFVNDSGGARVQEGIGSLAGYGRVFYNNVLLSGVVPQIAIIAGPCAGGAAYSPALTDFIIQTRKAHMFITGPNVIAQVTGEQVTAEALGGADAHGSLSGVTHFVVDDDQQAILVAQKLLSFLPQNNTEDPPIVDPDPVVERDPMLAQIVPVDGRKGYDVREVIGRIVDRADFLEVRAGFATNIVVGFARVNGRTVGIVANQPNAMSGVLDINASDKGSAFVRFCNAFNIPLVTLVDVPGFLPGVGQEHGGIIRHGAKMLYAYSAATVPKITVVLRKAYGGAYVVMGSKHLGGDVNLSWPTGQIAVMGAQGAVSILYRKELAHAADPAAARAELEAEYNLELANPYLAGERGYIDRVIFPHETRQQVVYALRVLRNKRETHPPKKHGNIPL